MNNTTTKKFIFITILLIPFYWVRFLIFNIPTNIVEVFIILTATTWLIENFPNIKKILNLQLDKLALLLGLIFIGLLLSTFLKGDIFTGLGIIKGWFLLPLLFALIVQQSTKNHRDKLSVLRYIYISGIIVAISSLISCFFGGLTYDNRLKGFSLSPNFLSMYLSPILIIAFWDLFSKNLDLFKNKSVKIFATALIISVIFLTYSYASWLAVVLSVFITFLIKKISKKNLFRLTTISLAVITLLSISQIHNQKFINIVTLSERSSLSSRIMIWESTTKIVSDNWILGIGPGEFQNKYLEYQKYFPPYLEWAVPHPHNIFAAFWINSGLLGLISFIVLIIIWIKSTFEKIKKDATNDVLIVIFSIVIYILIHGIFDTTYWKNDLSIIFWIIILIGQLDSA